MGAPVSYTCDAIDGVITIIKRTVRGLEQRKKDLELAIAGIDEAISDLEDQYTEMEDLRTANSKLREWGERLEGKLESAESDKIDLAG